MNQKGASIAHPAEEVVTKIMPTDSSQRSKNHVRALLPMHTQAQNTIDMINDFLISVFYNLTVRTIATSLL